MCIEIIIIAAVVPITTDPQVLRSLNRWFYILYSIFYIWKVDFPPDLWVGGIGRAPFTQCHQSSAKKIFIRGRSTIVNNCLETKPLKRWNNIFFGKCHNLNFRQLWLSGWCECGGWADVEYWYAFVSHLPALPYLYLLSQYSPAENYRLEYFWLLWSIDVFVSLIYVPYFLVLIAQNMKTTHLPKYCAKHSTPNVNTLILLWPCGNFISSAHVAGCTQNVI